jgi:hypothetical protein
MFDVAADACDAYMGRWSRLLAESGHRLTSGPIRVTATAWVALGTAP